MTADREQTRRDAPRRIGVCFNGYEPFYWEADTERTCPSCSADDETPHGFFVAEAELEQAERERDEWRAKAIACGHEVTRMGTILANLGRE